MTLPHRTRATPREHLLALPGDEMIRHAAGSLTHAITVRCSRRELWPWVIQMGADRAGWYSYDSLDNGGRHSAEGIVSSCGLVVSIACRMPCSCSLVRRRPEPIGRPVRAPGSDSRPPRS